MDTELEQLPPEFQYLTAVLAKYAVCDRSVDGYNALIGRLDGTQLAEITDAYREILRRDDMWRLSDWVRRAGGAGRRVKEIFVLFEMLAAAACPPFAYREVAFVTSTSPLDWSKLPARLAYLREPAMTYGRYGSSEQRDELERILTAEQRDELEALARRVNSPDESESIGAWRRQFDAIRHPEANLIDNLLQVLVEFAPRRQEPARLPPPVYATAPLTLHCHAGGVWAVAFRGDGRLLASAGAGEGGRGELIVSDLESNAAPARLDGHGDLVRAAAFLPDGRLASGGEDGAVRLWDPLRRRQIACLGHRGPVTAMAVAAGGRVLAAAWVENFFDVGISLWDVATLREIATLEGHEQDVTSMAACGTGLLFTGSLDCTLRFWDVASATLLATLDEPVGDSVSGVAASPDGRIVASVNTGFRGNVKLWDVDLRRLRVDLGHQQGASSVAFRADGRLLAAGCGNDSVRLWDPANRRLVQDLSGLGAEVTSVRFGPTRHVLAAGTADGTVRVWQSTG